MTEGRRLARRSAIALGVSVVPAGAVSVGWWRAWMYSGWPGPPTLLGRLISLDGEAAYDIVHADMFLVLLAAFSALAAWLLGRR